MYDMDLYREFNKIEYDETKRSVYYYLKTGMSLEVLYDFNIIKKIDTKITDDYEKIWTNFVDYVKLIQEGIISNDGHLIATNLKIHYDVPQNEHSAWQTFREHLEKQGKYTFEEIEGIEKSANKILNSLSPNTTESGPVKGLVMGYVQSGKTNSIESIMTMAADYGYNVFIVLSGIIENLRKQNLTRMREDIEFTKNSNIHWEFIEQILKTTPKAHTYINSNKKIVIVSLKNSTRLSNIKKWLFETGDINLTNAKILVIDDEADQAGLNTNDINKEDSERSKINKLITEIIDNYTDKVGAMNYIGYTATPYGNFLNEVGSIYPKDFIYVLPKSPKYIGALEIFGSEELSGKKADGLDVIRRITTNDLDTLTKIEEDSTEKLPESLINSICWFICTLATFRYRNKVTPVTMLVHDNRKTDKHLELSNSISNYLNKVDRDEFIERCASVYQQEIERYTKQDFYDVMTNYGRDIPGYEDFEDLRPIISEILSYKTAFAKNDGGNVIYSKGINAVVDNSNITKILTEEEQPRLIYPDKNSSIDYATGFIVVGGDTLSRGLTLEGLTTTYFARKSDTVDSLMQMGRWFGYRIGYELLQRIWLDSETNIKYNELTKVEVELRNDLNKYVLGTNPKECGPVILATYNTRITSKNKMQSAKAYEMDYRGASSQTVLFDNDIKVQKKNIELTDNFIKQFRFTRAYNSKSNLLTGNIEFEQIAEYLRKFKFCAESTFFNNIESFCKWIEECNYPELKKWNIILAGIGEVDIYGNVGKVERSKLSNYEDKTYFNIGALRNTKDIISDMDPDKYSIDYSNEKSIIKERSSYKVPQLIIYRIDGRCTPKMVGKNRVPINLESDIIGLYIYVPGTFNKEYIHSVQIDIKN